MTRAEEILYLAEQVNEEGGLISKGLKFIKKLGKGARDSVPKPTGKGFTSMGGSGEGKAALRRHLGLE